MPKIGTHTVRYKDSAGESHPLSIAISYQRARDGQVAGEPFYADLPEQLKGGLDYDRVRGADEKAVRDKLSALAAETHNRKARERRTIVVSEEGQRADRSMGENPQRVSIGLSYTVYAYREWVDPLGNVLRSERAACKRNADTGAWEVPYGYTPIHYQDDTPEVPFSEDYVARLDLMLAQMRSLRTAIREQVRAREGVTALVEGRSPLMLGPATG